jgi:hypothetical protein
VSLISCIIFQCHGFIVVIFQNASLISCIIFQCHGFIVVIFQNASLISFSLLTFSFLPQQPFHFGSAEIEHDQTLLEAITTCTAGYVLIDLSTDNDGGRSPKIVRNVLNNRPIDPKSIIDLQAHIATVGLQNRSPECAIDIQLNTDLLDTSCLRGADTDPAEFQRVIWNEGPPADAVVYLHNGLCREWIVRSNLARNGANRLQALSAAADKVSKIVDKTSQETQELTGLLSTIEEQKEENLKVSLWLARVLSTGGFILRFISQMSSDIILRTTAADGPVGRLGSLCAIYSVRKFSSPCTIHRVICRRLYDIYIVYSVHKPTNTLDIV